MGLSKHGDVVAFVVVASDVVAVYVSSYVDVVAVVAASLMWLVLKLLFILLM